ncbi:MAG TPA: peptidylprolyl isomerase [Acidimicrobiales bacterium]|nr:peptidylprolyl isomerase [Acidimicrobiales bacterium]
MPNPKRQRKREARRARQEALLAARRRRQNIRRGVIGLVAAVLVVALFLIFNVSNDKSQKTSATANTRSTSTTRSTTTSTTAPTTTTTVSAAQAARDRAAAQAADSKAGCPPLTGTATRTIKFAAAPPTCTDPGVTYLADVTTDVGSFTITFDPKLAPKTVNNFVFLALNHYYDGIIFHRVIPGFVVQGGDPTGTGQGGPGYQFADELPPAGSYKIGSVAMANSGPNTNGSQFFIVTGSQGTQLPPSYSLFGQVTSGMDVVSKIEADGSAGGTPKTTHKMLTVTITVE